MNKRKLKGITLIDALVSLVVLSLGFLMILSIFPISGVFIKSSENRLLAKQIAQTYLEYYSSPEHWTDTSTGGTLASGTKTVSTIVNGKKSSIAFQWNASSSQSTAGGSSGELMDLLVTVTWREQYLGKSTSGALKQIELATIVINPD